MCPVKKLTDLNICGLQKVTLMVFDVCSHKVSKLF